ncbi:hypothetical protein IE81DRAFT_326532, partial [Ceraceosorus guamensis]
MRRYGGCALASLEGSQTVERRFIFSTSGSPVESWVWFDAQVCESRCDFIGDV